MKLLFLQSSKKCKFFVLFMFLVGAFLSGCGSQDHGGTLRPDSQAQMSNNLIQDMRAGLNEGQFELYYQPQVDVKTTRILGAEGLLRWSHPQQGFVSPATFIPLAESSGLIVQLGEWVLHAACKQLALWAQQSEMKNLVLAVNVSPRQFQESDFVERVRNALIQSGAPASQLKLEITEDFPINDVQVIREKMLELKKDGIRFSLDDFGTGYASYKNFEQLPVDEIKIDRSFLRGLDVNNKSAEIVKSIIKLGAELKLNVIAEGVEKDEQLSFLAKNNCPAWQGYKMSPPVPVQKFEALIRSHSESVVVGQ